MASWSSAWRDVGKLFGAIAAIMPKEGRRLSDFVEAISHEGVGHGCSDVRTTLIHIDELPIALSVLLRVVNGDMDEFIARILCIGITRPGDDGPARVFLAVLTGHLPLREKLHIRFPRPRNLAVITSIELNQDGVLLVAGDWVLGSYRFFPAVVKEVAAILVQRNGYAGLFLAGRPLNPQRVWIAPQYMLDTYDDVVVRGVLPRWVRFVEENPEAVFAINGQGGLCVGWLQNMAGLIGEGRGWIPVERNLLGTSIQALSDGRHGVLRLSAPGVWADYDARYATVRNPRGFMLLRYGKATNVAIAKAVPAHGPLVVEDTSGYGETDAVSIEFAPPP